MAHPCVTAARALLWGHVSPSPAPGRSCPAGSKPQSGPAFPSCPSRAKGLLPAVACVPACKEDILPGMSPASVQHISGEEQIYQAVPPCQLLGPVPCSGGGPGALPGSASVAVALGVGAGGSMATPAPRGGDASSISRELSTARGAALPRGLPDSRRQLGYFPSVSKVCPCQTCSGVPPRGAWGLAVGVPGEGSPWAWLAPVDVTTAGCTGSGGRQSFHPPSDTLGAHQPLTRTCLSSPSCWPGGMASGPGAWDALPRPGRSLSESPHPPPDVLCSWTSRHTRDRHPRELGDLLPAGRDTDVRRLRGSGLLLQRGRYEKGQSPAGLAERGDRQREPQASLPQHGDPGSRPGEPAAAKHGAGARASPSSGMRGPQRPRAAPLAQALAGQC